MKMLVISSSVDRTSESLEVLGKPVHMESSRTAMRA